MKNHIYLGLIIALGVTLRFWHNTDISLWHDEAFSALLIKYSWGEMFYRIGLDVHPPLYYIALRLWHYVFGDSLLALRSFSVFFGAATVCLAYSFSRRAFRNSKIALVAALFVACNPFQIQYATEARMYTFGAFLALLGAYFALSAVESQTNQQRLQLPEEENSQSTLPPWLWYILFGLTMTAMALTHYYLLFTAAALFCACLVSLMYRFRGNIFAYKGLLGSGVLAAILFLPWIKWFIYQAKQVGAGYWIPAPNIWSVPTTIWQLMFGVSSSTSETLSQILLVSLTILALSLTIYLLIKNRRLPALLTIAGFLAPFGGSLLFLLLAKLQDSNSSVYLVRYFIFASSFLLITLAFWAGTRKNVKVLYISTLLISGVFLFSTGHYWKQVDFSDKYGMHGLAGTLARENNNSAVYAGTTFEYFNLKYYRSQQQNPWPEAKLYSGGRTSTKDMQHFEGTAILTDQELLPNWNDEVKAGDQAFIVWTTGFGVKKPEVPNNWTQIQEWGFSDVRPYPGVWVMLTKYQIN